MNKRDFGTARVNGKKLKNQMRRRGLLPGELADMTYDREQEKNRVSERTVEKMMAGRPVRIVLIREIAGTLGLRYEDLVEDDAAPVPEPSANGQPANAMAKNIRQVVVELDGDFHSFDQTKQLAELMQKLIETMGARGAVRVVDVAEGSIRITVEMSEEDYQRAITAFREGKLQSLGVRSVRDATASPEVSRDAGKAFRSEFSALSHRALTAAAACLPRLRLLMGLALQALKVSARLMGHAVAAVYRLLAFAARQTSRLLPKLGKPRFKADHCASVVTKRGYSFWDRDHILCYFSIIFLTTLLYLLIMAVLPPFFPRLYQFPGALLPAPEQAETPRGPGEYEEWRVAISVILCVIVSYLVVRTLVMTIVFLIRDYLDYRTHK